jgi:hypothetical protein
MHRYLRISVLRRELYRDNANKRIPIAGVCVHPTGLHPPPPPSKGSGPYGILAVGCNNLWPAVRTEQGQEGWLKQPVAKV